MARMPWVPFTRPRSYSSGRPGGPPRFVVIHFTAGSESVSAAENGVDYDLRRTDGTSAHFYTDRDSIIQSVDTADRAHTALYHGNLWGIHIEQCGTKQTREQWLDEASRPTIRNTAKVAAWAMRTHDIPLVRLVDRQVRTGRGICGHKDITYGFPEDEGTHEDPGTAYPYDVLFADIRAELQGDDDMPTVAEFMNHVIDSPSLGPQKVSELLKQGMAANQGVGAMRVDLAGVDTRLAGLTGAVTALLEAGGSPETAQILARIDEQAEASRSQVAALQADLDAEQAKTADLTARLAAALAT